MYAGDAEPDHDAIAAFGLKLEGHEPQVTECWPENWMALQVFAALATQWNVGQASTIGLRYESMPVALQMAGIPKKEQASVMNDVREMETEALRLFNKGRA